MKYWYSITFKDGTQVKLTSHQLVTFDLAKPLFKLEYISKKWVDKTNTFLVVTSEVRCIEFGEARDD